MFSSFSSSHLPPPHLISISPLCPACHPILSAAFTANPLMLYFKSNFQAHDVEASEYKNPSGFASLARQGAGTAPRSARGMLPTARAAEVQPVTGFHPS